MAIIYTYPVKATPNANDLILISDSEDSNKTKQVKISTLPGGSGSGVSSVTSANIAITVADSSTTPVLTSVAYSGGANIGHVPAGSGSSASVYLDGTGNWSTPAGSGGISSITGTSPVSVTSGSTPVVSMAQASASDSGYLTTTDWNTFNNKSDGTPGGSSTQFQYNNGTTFAGTDSLRFDADKIHMGRSTSPITRGQLVMYGDGTNASDIQLYNGGNNRFLKIAQQAGATQDLTLTFPGVAPGGNNKILESDSTGQLSWIATPTGTTYSAGTGLALNGTTFSLASGAALTNLGGGTGTTFLRKDGTWATPTDTNTNIANTDLQLSTNRTLDLSNSDAADYALTFISTLGGVAKNLFKFDQIGSTSPRFTVGHQLSAYEGTIVLQGNGSNRTGQVQFENAAGTYYTSIKASNTFGANQNIGYVLPDLQGAANSVLTNNGSGTLSWTTTSEPTEITGTTAVNSSTFANTPFTFANTNGGSAVGAPVATQVASSFGNKHISFYYNTTFSGGINQSGTNTVNYATSSDYRLKENVVEMTGAVNRVKQLNPSRFNFIADGPSRTVDGFLAHEVSSIVPEAITGSKDAVDAEGNIIPQGIDQSKLVPLLVGAIKELTARIEALEA